jgi:lipid II:glycine glycyltransferase (peptidoglycan interpeptide bridge formation enzyme)
MVGDMAARKGFQVGVSRELVRDFLSKCPKGKNVLITALNSEQQPISWALIVSFAGSASYLVGAGISSRHPAFVRGASNLVQMEAIRWARSTNNTDYNLEGLDPEGNPGVYRFKERMNGKMCVQKGLWVWSRNRIKKSILGAIIKQRMNF